MREGGAGAGGGGHFLGEKTTWFLFFYFSTPVILPVEEHVLLIQIQINRSRWAAKIPRMFAHEFRNSPHKHCTQEHVLLINRLIIGFQFKLSHSRSGFNLNMIWD